MNDETDWGHVTIKSIKAQSLDEPIFVAVVFGNYVGPLGIGKEPLSERDHFFHRRFDRRFIEAQGVNEASYGAQRISFCADRAAVEVTLASIRAAITEWNEAFPAVLAEWADNMVTKAAEAEAARDGRRPTQGAVDT